MGSYCSVYFDGLEIISNQSGVPDDYAALFQESDRAAQSRPLEEGEELDYIYATTRDTILKRLALLGVTSEASAQAFETWLAGMRDTWSRYAEDGWGQEESQALQQLSYEEWRRRVPEVLATRYATGTFDRDPVDVIDRELRDMQESWLWFDGYGSLVSIRAMLEACDTAALVSLDVSELVSNGYHTPDGQLGVEARKAVYGSFNPLLPTLVLAEGSSDITVLRRSLPVLHPELAEYFSFFNHAELSVDGGAVFLVKFLKAFAAANMMIPMVAVFDNDTAGLQSLRYAQSLGLPTNIMLTRLPDSEIARNYPTIGPQGHHDMDVNGLAAGIELYLGERALKPAGAPRPVRWTGYNQGAKAYQGEVESKGEVLEIFLSEIDAVSTPAAAREAFPDLAKVWDHLIDTIEKAADAPFLRGWVQLQRNF